MRTYGRVPGPNGTLVWVVVETAPNGDNSAVWLTTLCQCLKLNLGESPTYANYGIPAEQSVNSQVAPDFNAAQTQTQFAGFFASLSITRVSGSGAPPVYSVRAVTKTGAVIGTVVAT